MKAYTWNELQVGVAEELAVKVAPAMIERFVATTGDVNPLHCDDAHARSHGFAERVVHGLLTASFYSTLVGMHLPGRDALLHGLKIDFTRPVYAGDELVVRGVVSHRNEAFFQLEITGTITRSGSETVSRAVLRVGLLARE